MELGSKVAPKVGKAFVGLGDDALKAFKTWWKGPVKNPSEIAKVLEGGTLDDALKDVASLGKGAYERLVSNLKNMSSEIKQTFIDKLGESKALRNRLSVDESRLSALMKSKPTDPDKVYQWELAYGNLEDIIGKNREQLAKLEKEIAAANQFSNTLDSRGVEDAIKLLEGNPELMVEFPRLGKWKNDAVEGLLKWHDTYRAKSLNLGKAKQFMKEYAEVMTRPSDDPYRVAFLNNSENKNYLSALRGSSNKIAALFRKIEAPDVEIPRAGLLDTMKDWAKKMGVGAAALGVGTAGYKVYDWFHSNPPHNVSTKAEKIAQDLRSLKVSGEAANIVNKIITSLLKMSQLADKVNIGMSEDPEKAASSYLSEITKELSVLADNLDKWNIVMSGAENKDQAQKIGQEIVDYINNFNNALKNLAKNLGVSISTVKTTPIKPVNTSEAQKIQKLLINRGYNIPITGKVDQQTILALEALEREFPEAKIGKDIAGTIVNRDTGNIISYNDLTKLLNILEKQ